MKSLHLISTSVLLAALAFGPDASAQGATPQDRAGAADAYDHGVAAFRAGDYVEAAVLFERANRLFPSPAAVVQAIRSHRNIRNARQAGSLALQLENEPGLSPAASSTVRQAIAAARPRFARVEVVCSADCSLTVNGEEQDYPRFFVDPNVEIEIVAVFSSGVRTQRVTGRAGGSQTVTFEAPAGAAGASTPAVAASTAADESQDLTIEETSNPYRISRLRFLSRPRATFFVTAASTLAVGGITLWSAVDASASHNTLQQAIALGAPADEIAAQTALHRRDVRRTHGYIGFSAMMIGLTGLVAGFTDWTPNDRDVEASVDVLPGGAAGSISGRF